MDPSAVPSQHLQNANGSLETPDGTPPALHLHRRMFIGPMPEQVVSQTEAHAHKHHYKGIFLGRTRTQENSSGAQTDVSQIIKDHAFHFFMKEGGRVEDWDAEQENGRTEELLHRWRNSEWGAIWHRRHRQRHGGLPDTTASRWVGGSFEVGYLLGVNILDEPPAIEDASHEEILPLSISRNLDGQSGRRDVPTIASGPSPNIPSSPKFEPPSVSPDAPETAGHVSASPTSDTGLLESPTMVIKDTSTKDVVRPILLETSLSQATSGSKQKGKGKKHVRYPEELEVPGPVSPTEVLGRTSDTLDATTSAAASFYSSPRLLPPDDMCGDVILRDRMLVKIYTTKAQNISVNFDETVHRTARDLQHEDYAEFMVVWRKDIIELYEDYATSLQEWAVGHKHLAYIIPLKSPKTRLSLYSFVDMTFCIACPPMRVYFNSDKWNLSGELEGTNIYVFKTKSRSRAYDWTWQLWRCLGGELPRSLDIRNPRLGTRVAMELPPLDLMNPGAAAKMFSRRNIIALCMRSLKPVPGWNNFVEYEKQRGRTLQLAWRSETHMDWVWIDENAEGEQREWPVLCGIAFKNSPQAPTLELRVAEHYPIAAHFKNSTTLAQPPAIEGYVERIRPNMQTKQSLYVVSHNGNLFTLSPQQAQPPSPPGSALMLGNMEEYKQNITRVEIERGIYQIMHAHAVCDLRSVIAVRRAFQVTPQHHHDQKETTDGASWFNVWSRTEERTSSDDEDEGGEEGLSKASERSHLRMKRSFELLLNTGRVVRFEVHSRRVANEWVERLRALVVYWKERHRANAKDEIDLAQARHPRLTPQIKVCDEHEATPEKPDLSAPYPALDTLFNWCVIDGCRPITKEGKLYTRKGLRGQYQLVQLFLVDGHLILFRVTAGNSLRPVMRKKINLLDAYICSGYLAALNLPKGQYRPNAATVARRYEDGLEVDDRDEDMLFVINYRKHAPVVPPRPALASAPNSTTNGNIPGTQRIPSLSEKPKLLVCRARSKLERDAWCWALNIEIEKLTRKHREREEKLRQTGNLRKFD